MELRKRLLQNRPILLDGGMGSLIMEKGLPADASVNVIHPDTVEEIHRAYIRAGSEGLTTNTFTGNRIYMETHNIETTVEQVNKAAAKLAHRAAKEETFLLGDLGSTGQLLAPYGTYSEEQFTKNFQEQAEVLLEEKIHGIIIETQADFRESLCALRACKGITELPILVSYTVSKTSKGYATMMGDTLSSCVQGALEAGAEAVGLNCGEFEDDQWVEAIRQVKEISHKPIIIQPNAGLPKLVKGKTTYGMSPTQYAQLIERCIDAGANIVGGCCGTTPAHIHQLALILKK